MGREKFNQWKERIKQKRINKKNKKLEYKKYKKERSFKQSIVDNLLWYIGNTKEKVISFIVICLFIFSSLYIELNATDNVTTSNNLINAFEMHNDYYNGSLEYTNWEKFLIKYYYGKYEKMEILLDVCIFLEPQHINTLNLSAEEELLQKCYDFISKMNRENELINIEEYYETVTIINSGIVVEQTVKLCILILSIIIFSKILCAIIYYILCKKYKLKGYSPK